MQTFSADALVRFATEILVSASTPWETAERVANSLVLSNLSGHDSHGLIRLMQYVPAIQDGRLQPQSQMKILKESPAVVHADGGWGLGQDQAHRLLMILMEKAKVIGIAAGTLHHCGHVGRLGEYGEVASANGLAFMGTVNNHGFGRGMAPPGGTQACLGTNPICLAMPSQDDPVILDIGTSVCAEGKIRVAFNKKEQVAANLLLDENGLPTTNPEVLYREPRGSILPLGGNQAYKGFGLGLLFDMLAGGFSGAPCSSPTRPNLSANAVYFQVMDPEFFAGTEHLLTEVAQLSQSVRNSPRRADVKEILLPGDPERKSRQARIENGIPIDDGTWQQLSDLARIQGVKLPDLLA